MIKDLWNKKGFRNVVIKGIIFLSILILLKISISYIFANTTFFDNNLRIPDTFKILPFILRLTASNAIIFGCVVFVILTYKELIKLPKYTFENKQIFFSVSALIFLVAQYIFKYIINHNLDYFSQATVFWGVVKLSINIFFILSLSLAIFGLKFVKLFIKKFKSKMLLSMIVSVLFFFLMLLVQNLWTYFSNIISDILYEFFRLFFNNVTYKPFVTSITMTEGGGPLLGLNEFKAIIGKPCSGIDSFLLFTSLYALIFILDYKKLKKNVAILLYFIGITGMFLTNLIRILLLFIVGAFWNPKFAVGAFHTNAGWILFIVYFFVFWYFASKIVYSKTFK